MCNRRWLILHKLPEAFKVGCVGINVSSPRILLLGSVDPDTGLMRLKDRWAQAFEGCHVKTVPIDPTRVSVEQLDQELRLADGIMLSGGDINIHPSHYGKELINQSAYTGDATPKVCYDERRFEVSKRMIEYARNHNVPILGVCLGAQEMNVVMGGSLQQKLEGHMTPYVDSDDFWDMPLHSVYMNRAGSLCEIFGNNVLAQSSVHNVGVVIEDLAPGLKIEALDGAWNVVEAFSLPGHPFFMGVQFHAESSRFVPENAFLIKAFSNKAREHAYSRPFMPPQPFLIKPSLDPETGKWRMDAA